MKRTLTLSSLLIVQLAFGLGAFPRIRAQESKSRILIDFRRWADRRHWDIVTDAVMGGQSRGWVEWISDSTALMSGNLSLENRGGFVTLQALRIRENLEEADGIVLRVRGDGRTYAFRIFTESAGKGIAYQAGFSTRPDVWISVVLPFSDFQPFFRGRVVLDAPPVDLGHIRGFGVIIADDREGGFRLELRRISTHIEEKGPHD